MFRELFSPGQYYCQLESKVYFNLNITVTNNYHHHLLKSNEFRKMTSVVNLVVTFDILIRQLLFTILVFAICYVYLAYDLSQNCILHLRILLSASFDSVSCHLMLLII